MGSLLFFIINETKTKMERKNMEGVDPYAKFANFELSSEDQKIEDQRRMKFQAEKADNHRALERFRLSGIDQKSPQKYRHRGRPN